MKSVLKVVFLFVVSLMITGPLQAQTYKWVDEKGITHYGDSIPPEYSNRGNMELNKRGVMVKKTDPLPTPDQRKAMEEEEQRQREVQRKAVDQKRKDMALLNTYTSEKEIDLTKERNVRQIEFGIKGTQERIAEIRKRMLQQQEAVKQNPQNSVLAQDLKRSVQDNERKIVELEANIAKKKVEMDALSARYEAEKVRFRELTEQKNQPSRQPVQAKVAVQEAGVTTTR